MDQVGRSLLQGHPTHSPASTSGFMFEGVFNLTSVPNKKGTLLQTKLGENVPSIFPANPLTLILLVLSRECENDPH